MPTATLTTLTPVHVGSGQTLKKGFDFIQENGQIGFIDLNKVVELIGEETIPQLSSAIEKGESLNEFLKNRGFKNFNLKDVSHRTATAVAVSNSTTELKEHYHSAMQGVSIPGSSIKGAIKTAIWDSLTTDNFLQSLSRSDFGFAPKWKDAVIDKKLFGPNANEKSTRFLKLGDVYFNNLNTQVHEVGIYNAYYNGWNFKKGNNFLLEVIPAKSSAKFELKLDSKLLQKNIETYPEKWYSINTDYISEQISSFCKRINTYTKALLDWEFTDLQNSGFDSNPEGEDMLDILDEVYKKIETAEINGNEAIFRIGGHNGWKFTTGGWITKPSVNINDQDFNQLRKAIQKRDYSDMDLWPKTRKMTMNGTPLGFVKIQF